MSAGERFYEVLANGTARSAPAALRNREPIGEVLRRWLPPTGLVLEVASGTGEHAAWFARAFPHLQWQPSDVHPEALASIAAWRDQEALANLLPPLTLDAGARDWPLDRADAVLCINMVHISPWSASLGLIEGARSVLPPGAPLILYGPWREDGVELAPSNQAFDADLRRRDPAWGLRTVEAFADAAQGFVLEQRQPMPANNLMLLLRRFT